MPLPCIGNISCVAMVRDKQDRDKRWGQKQSCNTIPLLNIDFQTIKRMIGRRKRDARMTIIHEDITEIGKNCIQVTRGGRMSVVESMKGNRSTSKMGQRFPSRFIISITFSMNKIFQVVTVGVGV